MTKLIPILLLLAGCSPPMRQDLYQEIPQPDLAAAADLSTHPPDLAITPSPTRLVVHLAACRSGLGYVLSADAVACPGRLTYRGDLQAACTAGWAVCNQNPVSREMCASLPGFFATSCTWWQMADAPPQDVLGDNACAWTAPTNAVGTKVLRGCGSAQGTGPAIPDLCGDNLTTIAPCVGKTSSWSCDQWPVGDRANLDITYVINHDPASGVMCCRK